MSNLATLKKIFLDTFRTELIIENPETIKDFNKKQITVSNKEVKFINLMIDNYNTIIHALNIVDDKKLILKLLKKVDTLDDEIDLYISLLNDDFKALTAIVNKSAWLVSYRYYKRIGCLRMAYFQFKGE